MKGGKIMQKSLIKGITLGVASVVISGVIGKYVPFMKI